MSLKAIDISSIRSRLLNKFNRLHIITLLVIAFIAGISFAYFSRINFWSSFLSCAVFLILALLFIQNSFRFLILLTLSFFSLGSTSYAGCNIRPADHITNIFKPQSGQVIITGTVISQPSVGQRRSQLIVLSKTLCQGALGARVSGKILVRSRPGFLKGLAIADVVRLQGKLYKPYNFDRAGLGLGQSFDYRAFLERQDIHLIMSINNNDGLRIIGEDKGYLFLKMVYRLRQRLNDILFAYLPQLPATFYSAIILGEKGQFYPQLREIFVQTGTVHILAISGLNIGIVSVILFLFLKAIGFKRRVRLIVCLFSLPLYCLLTGASSPVLRATIMAIFLIIGLLLERESSLYNSLALAAFVILLFDPLSLFDISFQLTFMSVVFMVLFNSDITRLLSSYVRKMIPQRFLKDEGLPWFLHAIIVTISVTLVASLGVEPLILYYFKMVTPLALLTNVIVVPTLTIITALGFAFLLCVFLIPPLAAVFAVPAGMAAAILIQIIAFFSRLPGAYIYLDLKMNLLTIFLSYLFLFCLGSLVQAKARLS